MGLHDRIKGDSVANGKAGGGALYGMRGMFDGGGGQQQQPPPTFYSNPFSPPQQQDQPWQQAHFQNNSFTPWLQNVSALQHPSLYQPLPKMFGPGGYF